MKFLLLALAAFLFFGCVSSGQEVSQDGAFKTTYSEVTGESETIHEDLEVGYVWNLRDNLMERENILLAIKNGGLYAGVLYQGSIWSFFTKAVFMADGKRLEIPLSNRNGYVVKGKIVRESYTGKVEPASVEKLRALLSSETCGVGFVGDNYTTDKIALKPKVRAALLATVEKSLEL